MIANLPNILTLGRILLLPFFAVTIIYGEFKIALLIFFLASVTDFLDGFIARIKNQTTYLGRILDPVADKFFLITSFVLMSAYGFIPKWLTIIVISKDVIVLTGCVIIYMVTHNLKIEPTLIGKVTSASQFVLIGLILVFLNIDETLNMHISLFISVGVLTAVSGLHYVYRGLKQAHPENAE
jgi:cardiolipin synthase